MVHPFIGIHAGLGELGILCFVWVLVELFHIDSASLRRIKIAAFLGLLFIVLSWVFGGIYYTGFYGPTVKPLIKAGPAPWAHDIIMELKEHTFLFLPVLAFTLWFVVIKTQSQLARDAKKRRALQWLCALCAFIGISMGVLGYLISTSARLALEVGVKP